MLKKFRLSISADKNNEEFENTDYPKSEITNKNIKNSIKNWSENFELLIEGVTNVESVVLIDAGMYMVTVNIINDNSLDTFKKEIENLFGRCGDIRGFFLGEFMIYNIEEEQGIKWRSINVLNPTKKIIMKRFLYLKKNICILNEMVHSDEYKTIIMNDDNLTENEKLTEEIARLKKAVMRFEKETGLKIEID